ncbi:hypothetical protein DFH09DRAFT_1071432 [Mycena vulgaris]|nr:hypothetical protein DFH09DRAFT_1071432 [Mycena vulgaris]
MPALTHLCLAYGAAGVRRHGEDLLQRVLDQWANLLVLVIMWHPSQTSEALQMAINPPVSDTRFVVCVAPRNFWDEWEAGARVVPDFWAAADAFVAQKHMSEIEVLVGLLVWPARILRRACLFCHGAKLYGYAYIHEKIWPSLAWTIDSVGTIPALRICPVFRRPEGSTSTRIHTGPRHVPIPDPPLFPLAIHGTAIFPAIGSNPIGGSHYRQHRNPDLNAFLCVGETRGCLHMYFDIFFAYIPRAPSVTETFITSVADCRTCDLTPYPFLLPKYASHEEASAFVCTGTRQIARELVGTRYDQCHTMTFPGRPGSSHITVLGNHSILDLLAVAELVTQHDHTRDYLPGAGNPLYRDRD